MSLRLTRRVPPVVAVLLSVGLLAGMVAPAAFADPAQSAVSVDQSVVVNSVETTTAAVPAGTQLTVAESYRCSLSSCAGATVTVPFPAGLALGTPQLSPDVASSSFTGSTLTLVMKDPLSAGTAGQVTIPVTIPAFTTPGGTVYSWTATTTASNAPTASSSTITLTAEAGNFPTISTTLQSGGAVGQLSTYSVQVCAGASVRPTDGPLQVNAGSQLVSALPSGAVFISASDGGTWAAGGDAGSVTWTIGAIQQYCASVTFVVTFPSSDVSNFAGASKTETATWTGQSPGDGGDSTLGSANATIALATAVGVGAFQKWSYTSNLPVGQGMTYFLTATNTGNASWDSLVTDDPMPAAMMTTNVTASNTSTTAGELWVSSRLGPDGIAGNGDDGTLIEAATIPAGVGNAVNLNPYATWPSGAAALPTGDVVDEIQVRLGDTAPGVGLTVVGINATPMAAALDGTVTNIGDVVTNTATNTFTVDGTPSTPDPESATITIAPAIPTVTSRNFGGGTLNPGVTTTSFALSASTSNFPLPDPVSIHLLSPGVSMTSWAITSSVTMPDPTLTKIDNFDPAGDTLLRWTFPPGTSLPTNQGYTITIQVALDQGAWGTKTDQGYASSTSITPFCADNYFGGDPDADNKTGDGDVNKVLCRWDASMTPAPSASGLITSLSQGSWDSTFVPGPATSFTSPGHNDVFRSTLTNSGTVQLDNAVIIDVLPRPGDTQIISASPRNPTTKTFPVVLRGLPIVPSTLGVDPIVSFTTVVDACQPELSNSPVGCTDPAWSTTPPVVLSTVTAVKVDFTTNNLDPFNSWQVDLPVTTPTTGVTATDHAVVNPDPTHPENDQIAYNSAAFVATNVPAQSSLLPAESQAVALRVPSAIGHEGPPPAPVALTSTGAGTAPQTVTASVPSGGTSALLDSTLTPVTSLNVPGVGLYTIVPATGVITFTAVVGFTGTPPAVTYQVTDVFAQSGQGTYTPTVTVPPAGPAALASTGVATTSQTVTASIPAGGSVALLNGSTDPVTTITVANVGTYDLDQSTGIITFTPVLGYHGTAAPITYRATAADSTMQTSTYTATVTMPAAPIASAETTAGVGTAPETTTVTLPPGGSLSLLDGSNNPVASRTVAGVGTWTVTGASAVVFQPVLGYQGSAAPIGYQVTDSYGQTASSTVTSTVTPPGPPPAPTVTSAPHGTPTQSATLIVPPAGSVVLLDGDSHPVLTLVVPGQGTYTLDPETANATFTSIAGFNGTPTPIRYQVTDAYGQTAIGSYVPEAFTPTTVSTVTVPTGGTVAATPGGLGYWALDASGILTAHGNAADLGSENGVNLASPIVAISSSATGQGYWLAAADGGVFTFGDARFFGSLGAVHLTQPIVAIARTPDNGGYWLAAADGGVFAFGDAAFYGSLGAVHLNGPITAMTTAPDGRGYWLAAADGGVFTFGSAGFYGSQGQTRLNKHINGIVARPDGLGYWLIALDGGVFTFDSTFYGSLGKAGVIPITGIILGAATGGYRLVGPAGDAYPFGTTP